MFRAFPVKQFISGKATAAAGFTLEGLHPTVENESASILKSSKAKSAHLGKIPLVCDICGLQISGHIFFCLYKKCHGA